MRAPFVLERYLTGLRDRTAWAPDCAIENATGPRVGRAMLHRIGYLWAIAMLEDRFDTWLLPVLATESPLLDALGRESRRGEWQLTREYFEERLESGACLLLIDGAAEEAERWPRNVRFLAE